MRMGLFGVSAVLAIVGIYIGSTLRAINIPDSSHYIEFVAKGTPNFLKIVGRGENSCVGLVSNGKGKIQCRLDSLDTGIDMRNTHMLGYLGASKHPMVTLTFRSKGDTFEGILELNGKRSGVTGSYSESPLKFDFTIDINDYGIDTPKYLGIGIEPDIRITAGLG